MVSEVDLETESFLMVEVVDSWGTVWCDPESAGLVEWGSRAKSEVLMLATVVFVEG